MTDQPLSLPTPRDADPLSEAAVPEAVATDQPRARGRGRARFVVAFLVGLLTALALGAGALYAYDRQYTGRILPGVHLGGVDLSGLEPNQAAERLRDAFGGMADGQAVLVHGDKRLTIRFASIGRRADVDGMVAGAMGIGRNGNPVEQAIANARTAFRGIDLVPVVTYDPEMLTRWVNGLAAAQHVSPIDARVELTETGFVVQPSETGRRADPTGPLAILRETLASPTAPSTVELELPFVVLEPEITTLEATYARIAADRIAQDVRIVEGDETWTIPAATVRALLAFRTSTDGGLEPVIDGDAIGGALAQVAKDVARAPQNATFTTSGGKITGVVAGKNGRALDTPATAARIGEVLAARAAGAPDPVVEPVLSVTPPTLTTEEAEAAAPLMKKISTWTTYFPISEKNGFGANIWIPALDIDGYVVGPGEEFDFWKAVGPVTRERGYRDGGAIINGRTEPQGALAGGICSCSTTLFNAALRAGFEMGDRRNHYYYIDRYPLGLDATVFKSGSGSVQTMSWTNDTEYPVLVRGHKIKDGNAGYVRFELYSVPNGRTVTLSKPTVKNVRPASDSVQYTTSLAPGVRKRIEYPVDGKDVWVTRTVRDAAGKIIHQETYYSHYARITGIVLVGKGSVAPKPPAADPTPGPS